jgi:hypothetical protein
MAVFFEVPAKLEACSRALRFAPKVLLKTTEAGQKLLQYLVVGDRTSNW